MSKIGAGLVLCFTFPHLWPSASSNTAILSFCRLPFWSTSTVSTLMDGSDLIGWILICCTDTVMVWWIMYSFVVLYRNYHREKRGLVLIVFIFFEISPGCCGVSKILISCSFQDEAGSNVCHSRIRVNRNRLMFAWEYPSWDPENHRQMAGFWWLIMHTNHLLLTKTYPSSRGLSFRDLRLPQVHPMQARCKEDRKMFVNCYTPYLRLVSLFIRSPIDSCTFLIQYPRPIIRNRSSMYTSNFITFIHRTLNP